MPVAAATLAEELATLLATDHFRDYCHNGLQVAGPDTLTHIATAATASQRACDAAVDAGADALLVHHGIIWGGAERIDGMLYRRLHALLTGGCALLAYHLPLDAHPTVGNNAVALDRLGLGADAGATRGAFGEYKGNCIGLWAEAATPLSITALSARCESAFDHSVLHCPGGPEQVRKIGIVTGGGQSLLLDAAAAGCDAFITGEASEQSWHEAAEAGIHLLACGHHATEDIAIHQLGASLAKTHGLRHTPLHLHNPI